MASGITSGPGIAPTMASSLPIGANAMPRLSHETEMQKLLADERMRTEQHKINYQQLKVEHAKLANLIYFLMVKF